LGWTGGNNWTAGVELQIDLFAGGSKLAELNRQRADQERSAANLQAFADSVRLDVRRAYYDLDSARQQVDVARAAMSQSEESLRIQQNRYTAGLCTVTDLLRVEDAHHRAATDYWNAVYAEAISYAALELATGTLTPSSPVVKP
jgi:outer membrane protein